MMAGTVPGADEMPPPPICLVLTSWKGALPVWRFARQLTFCFTDWGRRIKELNISRLKSAHFLHLLLKCLWVSSWLKPPHLSHTPWKAGSLRESGVISPWPCQQLCKANLLVQWLIISSSYMKLTKVNSVKKYLISDLHPKNCNISLLLWLN